MVHKRKPKTKKWNVSSLNGTNIELKMAKRDENKYKRARKCWLCEEKFNLDGGSESHVRLAHDIEVRSHCHLRGNYRVAGHQSCNINV